MFYFHSLRSLMNVVEPAVREILHSTPASEKPTSLYFVAVKGALCRLHQMGAMVILDPLDAIKDVLHSTICGFKYSDVVVALQRQFPGGKGRFTLVECKSRGGLD